MKILIAFLVFLAVSAAAELLPQDFLVIDGKKVADRANYVGETLLIEAYENYDSKKVRKLYAAQSRSPQFRFENFENTLKGTTKIAQVLQKLPEHFWKNSLLAFHPRGRQSGSATSPRIILFNKYSDFVIAIGLENNIEIMRWDYGGKQFQFRAYEFQNDSEPKPSEWNDSECLGCHVQGSTSFGPRPNWMTYRTWLGFAGSQDDGYRPNNDFGGDEEALKQQIDAERKVVEEFLKSHSNKGNYQYLKNLKTRFDTQGGVVGTERTHRPNAEFTSQIIYRATEKAVGDIQRDRKYESLKFLIAALLDDSCGFTSGKLTFEGLGLVAKGWADLETEAQKTDMYKNYLKLEKTWVPQSKEAYPVKRTVVGDMRKLVMLDALFGTNFTDKGTAVQNWSTGFTNGLEDWGKYGPLNSGGKHPLESFRAVFITHDESFDDLIKGRLGSLDCEKLKEHLLKTIRDLREGYISRGEDLPAFLKKDGTVPREKSPSKSHDS